MKICLKKGDILLVAALLLSVACGAIWYGGNSANGAKSSVNGMKVVTQSSSGFYRCDPLDSDTSFTVRTPKAAQGGDADRGENLVRIQNGSVRVERSNCDNQVCVNHDPVSSVGEQIVCLPHGLVIEVVEHEEDASALH